jgi:hypothetical protein
MGHHFSTDLARSHPQLDVTDVYAFESDLPGKTCMVMIVNPKSTAGDSGNFSAEALYKFHLGADKLNSSGLTYTVRFSSGTATVGLLEQALDSVGIPGRDLGTAQLNQITGLPTGLRFWAGTVRDPFFGNQNGLRELRVAFAAGTLDLDAFQRHLGQSPFTGIVSSAIVLEIPNTLLPSSIYYFASVDWHDHGHWHRSNRVAHVLVPHLYLFSASDEEKSNRHEHLPALDNQHHALAVETIEKYARLAGFQSDPNGYAERIAESILPDAVPYRIGSEAHYGASGANGRKLSDDAMDAALSWVVGAPVSDGVDQPDGRVTQTFPFVVPVE